jgi:hypothetical protein
VLPNFMAGPELVLPPAHVKSLATSTDDVLSILHTLKDNMQPDYTLLHPRIAATMTLGNLPAKVFSALAPRHVDEIADEVACALDTYFGDASAAGGDWRDIMVQDIMSRTAARVANRFIVGLPTCKWTACRWSNLFALLCQARVADCICGACFKGRNEEFVTAAATFSNRCILGGMMIRIFPEFLKP